MYHLISRGVNRVAIYRDDEDRREFLGGLRSLVQAREWSCLAYCLMDNHFHVLARTPGADVSDGMRELNGRYARYFNDRHGRSGHLFQGRFHGELVRSDGHLLESARYIDRNPVRAGLCRSPADWPWSGHGEILRPVADGLVAVDELLGRHGALFGHDGVADSYLRFVEEGVDRPVRPVARRGRPPLRKA